MNTKAQIVLSIYESDKSLSNREIARIVGCSRRYVRRLLNTIRNNAPKSTKMPRILIFDIETAPMEVYVWGLYKQTIPPDNIINDWFIIGWSGKWLFEPSIASDIVTPEEALAKSDVRILRGMWDLLEEADIIIAHNGEKFDARKLNARFITNGMTPPSSYHLIDTMKESKRHFAFSSYKLDYINKILGLECKKETTFKLWKRCVQGDEEALYEMNEYNEQDTRILEDLYVKLRPWIKSHPNLGLYMDTDKSVCPNCGNENLSWKGFYYTPAGRFRSFRCNSCGAIGRSRYSDLSKEERLKLVASVAR